MASIIEGYSYDIFISYRQKDNKYDGWVTEFVDNLKKELEATFKEEVSVYFDINPHDGLLETHDVDASLKDKLKCFVFIPIISRTYCDPKSFAWEHEFKAFVKQSSQDQIGLKVKLPNGNVASRVLSIQIHEISTDDKAHIERELGGILRPIEFIYKEPGVNRPLRGNEDHPNDNLNKTYYRNQINKVANAIDEIINSIKDVQAVPASEKITHIEPSVEVKKEDRKEVKEKSAKLYKSKLLIGGIALALLLVIASILAFPKIFKRNTLEELRSSGERISVAVMPFQNIANDTSYNYWGDWIQEDLINCLSCYTDELTVKQTESTNSLIQSKGLNNYGLITPSVASILSKKLNANVFIIGSIRVTGNEVRLSAQLLNTKTEQVINAFEKGPSEIEMIDSLIHSLRTEIADFLLLSRIKKKEIIDLGQQAYKEQLLLSTNSPEAYLYYRNGMKAFAKRELDMANEFFLRALKIDSNFVLAAFRLSSVYLNQGLYKKAKEYNLKSYKKRDLLPPVVRAFIMSQYSLLNEDIQARIKYYKQRLVLDDQDKNALAGLGDCYNTLGQYDNAIPICKKCLEIQTKWGSAPFWSSDYTRLGYAYHQTGNYRKEKNLYNTAEKDFPGDQNIIFRQAVLSLSEGDTIAANQYIKKYKSIHRENLSSEAVIDLNLASIYSEAGILDKAEEYYRHTLSLEPKNYGIMNTLAYFLIDKDKNVNEGLELVERALGINPNSYTSLHFKGWGLYKQKKYQEALEILQKSWDLRRELAVYNHVAFLHLEEAKKAVAGRK